MSTALAIAIGALCIIVAIVVATIWLWANLTSAIANFAKEVRARLDGVERRLDRQIQASEHRTTRRIRDVESTVAGELDGAAARLVEHVDQVSTKLVERVDDFVADVEAQLPDED